MLMTIKEYAKEKGISYEAVRRQIKRYSKELEGHLSKDGRTTLLDEDAVKFLDGKRADNPVVVFEKSKDEEIEQLRLEKENLLIRVAELQNLLLVEKEKVVCLQNEKLELLEKKEEVVAKKSWWKFWK